jgi:TonB dependent receptor.
MNFYYLQELVQAGNQKAERILSIRAAVGIYDQPPFYRELRRYDGTVNTDLKAQKSFQVVGGFDYNFKKTNDRCG